MDLINVNGKVRTMAVTALTAYGLKFTLATTEKKSIIELLAIIRYVVNTPMYLIINVISNAKDNFGLTFLTTSLYDVDG